MTTKQSTVFLLVFTFLLIVQSYSIGLNYNKNHSTITVFTPSQQTLALQIDYKSSDIHLAQQFKNQLDYVYLSKHNKNKLILNSHQSHKKHQSDKNTLKQLFFDFQQNQIEFNDGKVLKISGKIGLKPESNLFLKLLKFSPHKQSAGLKYNTQKQTLQVVYQGCHNNLIKFPINANLFYQGKQKTVLIRDISQNLMSEKTMISFLFPQIKDNIITIGNDEMQSKLIQISVNGKANIIPLLNVIGMFCHKKTHTHNYTCDFRHVQKQSSKISGILLSFDFLLCPDGIQILKTNQKQEETYFILHCFLLLLIFIACLIYTQDQIVVKLIKKLLNKKKYY